MDIHRLLQQRRNSYNNADLYLSGTALNPYYCMMCDLATSYTIPSDQSRWCSGDRYSHERRDPWVCASTSPSSTPPSPRDSPAYDASPNRYSHWTRTYPLAVRQYLFQNLVLVPHERGHMEEKKKMHDLVDKEADQELKFMQAADHACIDQLSRWIQIPDN